MKLTKKQLADTKKAQAKLDEIFGGMVIDIDLDKKTGKPKVKITRKKK